jgi:hypothetical protein
MGGLGANSDISVSPRIYLKLLLSVTGQEFQEYFQPPETIAFRYLILLLILMISEMFWEVLKYHFPQSGSPVRQHGNRTEY